MRHVPYVTVIVLAGVVGSTGCALIHGLDDYTTAERKGSTPDSPASVESGSSRSPSVAASTGVSLAACETNEECIAATARTPVSKPAPAVCVKATGRCAPLVTEDCPRVYGDYANDGAILVGTLLSEDEPSVLEQAALLAAKEIDESGGIPPARPVVMIGCNTARDVLRASRHLVETLRVPAVVGPTSGEHVVDVTQQISAKAGTLLMTPTSLAVAVSNLADRDLTWRATPSDAQRAKLVIEQIKDLEALLRATRGLTSVKLGVVHATDLQGMSARDAISAKLILNGRFINDAANAANVSVDAFAAGNDSAQEAIATKYATSLKPDIVFITSAEQVAAVMVPLEQALTAARAVVRPYYVLTDAAKTRGLLDAMAGGALPADIGRRIRGVGARPDASSAPVLQGFRAAFTARYGAPPPELGAPAAYDATYAIAYAFAATAGVPPSGASVAQGLRTLAVGSPAEVGAKAAPLVMSDLSAGKAVSLRGTFGLMHWDTSGDVTGGTIEVWCVGTGGGAPAFGSSGLTMDVGTQVVGGAFVQCQ